MKIINHLIFLTISFSMILLYNCSREKTASNNAGIDDIAHQDIQSECLDRPDTPDPVFGYMVLEALGNDLHIRHIDSYYQCSLLYKVEYSIDNFDITASESDTGPLCDCYCRFNLKSIVYDLKSGLYHVALIGIRGDTVGIDTVTVGGY